ncbi:MAG: hypothetical protein WCA20_16775 [Candidatus Sulfotelmatobacter sp.]
MPFSAVDAISPALEHTKRQLLQPFRLGQWVRLALVGLLAGELSSGGFKVPNLSNFNLPRHPGREHFLAPDFAGPDLMLFAGLIAVLVVAAFLLGILLTYVSSVMRFILFDSVLVKECHIREGWSRRQGPGWHYFLWKLLYLLATFGVLIVLVGIPAGFAFAVGWLNDPRQHMAALVLGGIALFLAIMIFVIGMAVIYVLTKDFVVPQMALENIGALEGWRRLWAMMKAEKSSYAGYIGMKIVLAIVVGIILGIVGFIIGLIILIPAAGVAVAAVLGGKAAGLGWTAATITLAVVAGSVLLAVFLFVMALISVPVIVFFPAYSIYFFAARYPALSSALYPAPPAPPPYNPPPLPAAPAG